MSLNVFIGVVTETGKLVLDAPKVFRAYVARFIGEEVEVEVRKRRSKRSTEQNAYYWGVIIPPLAEHCGYTHDEMHEALKAKFLGQEDLSRGLLRIGSTRKLSTAEFTDYIERVTVWAAGELGVVILPPERTVNKRRRAA
jgi:hypothetical protein